MIDTYRASDCHMEFAIRAGAAPHGATKKTHPIIRKLYKTCNLGTLFGQAANGLASRLWIAHGQALAILEDHRRLYARFWDWSERVVESAYDSGRINTRVGWRMEVPSDTKDTVVMNWQMQSTGAEIMRVAVIYLDRQNVQMLAPVHDGFLMTCRRDQIDTLREAIDFALGNAVEHVIPGFPMRWDVEVFFDRCSDEDGQAQWQQMLEFAEWNGGGRPGVNRITGVTDSVTPV